jgi:DNA-binding NarL/FixJ family response regulator
MKSEPGPPSQCDPVLINVVVVEDHPIMRDALVAAIETESDMRVIGQADNGIEAVAEVQRCRPDVVVMDLFLPGQGGIAAISEIKEKVPHVQFLALTSATDESLFLAALQAGAIGYLIKDSHRSALVEAVRQVAQGIATIPTRMSTTLVQRYVGGYVLPTTLTEREREILKLIGSGATNHEIAEQLFMSQSTVRTHTQHLYEKLGLETRTQLALYAVRIGLAS